MIWSTRVAVAAAILAAGLTSAAAQSGYTPVRVFNSAQNRFADFEAMVADIGRADVVFVGEEPSNGNTHRLELALLEGLARRRGEVTVSLEMFERDVQEPMEHFLMGHMTEAEFLPQARAWPNYAMAYKPLMDFAIAKNWPVVAANVPRSIVADVATGGLEALKARPDADRAWFARELKCPANDDYARRFRGMLGDLGTVDPAEARLRAERFYLAQCLRDETMGESIAQAHSAGAVNGKRPLVLHVNGAFHSDFREGVVERTRRRLPDKRLVVATILPVDDLDGLAPDAAARRRADYLIFTLR